LGGVNDFLYGDFNRGEIFSSGDINTEIDGVTLLRKAAEDKHVSDLHVRVGRPPVVRRMGRLVPLKGFPVLSKEDTENIIYGLLKEKQKKYLEENLSLDFSVEVQGAGRFRGNAFYYEGGKLGCVFRKIAEKIPPLSSLGLPPVVEALKKEHKGLILVTGPTGSGKSTTCAALCNEILNERGIHLLTIEDPIEYKFESNKGVVTQRNIEIDVNSFAKALKDALREDPDVIFVGEMRDKDGSRQLAENA
jgi:twitching motility protein PilT